MKNGAKVLVAGAAGLFGAVIVAGGAFAATGSGFVADTPGQVLQVQGVGSGADAVQHSAEVRLMMLKAGQSDGVELVAQAAAVSLFGSADTAASARGDDSASTEAGATANGPHMINPGTGAALGNEGNAGTGNSGNGNGNTELHGNGNGVVGSNGKPAAGTNNGNANPGTVPVNPGTVHANPGNGPADPGTVHGKPDTVPAEPGNGPKR